MSGAFGRLVSAAAVLGLALALARTSEAHPAGFTSVNRYVGVSCDAQGRVHIAYLLDFAELPAYAEIERLDADHDGTVSPAEQRAYLDSTASADRRRLDRRDRRRAGRRFASPAAASKCRPERGGSPRCASRPMSSPSARRTHRPPSPDSQDVRVHVVEPVFAERSGWREMSAEESSDATVAGGPTARPEDILAYSNPAAGGPPRIDEGRFVFRLRRAASSAAAGRSDPPAARRDPIRRSPSTRGSRGWPRR